MTLQSVPPISASSHVNAGGSGGISVCELANGTQQQTVINVLSGSPDILMFTYSLSYTYVNLNLGGGGRKWVVQRAHLFDAASWGGVEAFRCPTRGAIDFDQEFTSSGEISGHFLHNSGARRRSLLAPVRGLPLTIHT